MSRHPVLHSGAGRPVVQVIGFVRKELSDILRQPRLLFVLIAGPFIILLLFAAGYDQDSVRLRTLFVGPPDSVYEESVESYTEDIERYVETIGYTSDVLAARDALENGDADVVVVFPPDPVDTVLSGEQAVITVLHDKIDPLQVTAVEISAQIAVQELNTKVLQQVIGQAQDALAPVNDRITDATTLAEELRAAADAGDLDRVDVTREDLRATLDAIDVAAASSADIVEGLGGEADPEQQERLDALRAAIEETRVAADAVDTSGADPDVSASARTVADLTAELAPAASEVLMIDPDVATRPFVSDTENLLRTPIAVDEFFAPSALSLLLQHLGITFAALALVRDERLGLFEMFRVGPVSARHVLAGKYVAYLVLGVSVGAALAALVVLGLGVPLLGSWLWLGLCLVLLTLASIGLGLVLSALARSDSQAIQFAMLALLAGMFFGGFFLSLDAFKYPVKAVSWMLPVTYAIRLLQDVMLRGATPATSDVLGLVGLTAAYGLLASVLFARRLAVR